MQFLDRLVPVVIPNIGQVNGRAEGLEGEGIRHNSSNDAQGCDKCKKSKPRGVGLGHLGDLA